jgi:hypothetical protein
VAVRALAFLLLAAACGGKSGDARKVCERAAAKYEACIGEILGPEAKAMAAGKDGVAACAADRETVAMYKACLPVAECGPFLDCLEAYVARSATPIAADRPRAEQCAQHVADGLRAVAFQEARSDDAKDCLLDEARPWEGCIGAAEREVVQQYGAQRQRECEAWPAELAACVLGLPGAAGCDPDSYPLWRLPLAEGPAGPAVAWSVDLVDEDDHDAVDFGWAAEHTLIVVDKSGLRALRDGKVRWHDPAADHETAMTIAGGWIAIDAGADHGLALFEVATGKQAVALDGSYVERTGAAGDRLLVLTGGGEVHEVTPAKCGRGPACAKRLGELDGDALSWADAIGAWRDAIVMVSTEGVHVTDRKLETRAVIAFSADDVLLTPDAVIVADPDGVAVLPLAACAQPGVTLELESTQDRGAGPCVQPRREGGWIEQIAALPGGAVAFNDEGITEATHHVGSDGAAWETRTAAVGGVAGDDRHVYAVSLGFDAAGPVRLLALSRATGAVVWQTELAAKPPDTPRVRIVVGDGLVAVRVGGTLYVIPG